MTTTELPETTRPTTIESVKFHDGMIVTADDLDAAMRYPTSLLHTVFRGFFGCGVVCGLGLRPKQSGGWVLCIDRGVAIDSQGYPIELCAPVELDLSPEVCACEPPPTEVRIAVRRITSDEAAHHPCTCDLDEPRFDCRRVRDHVLVKAFTPAELDAVSGTVCRRTEEDTKIPPCDALTADPPCACGESWILLGGVTLDTEKGIGDVPDTSERRWVKPVEALCSGLLDRINELEKTVEDLKKQCAG